MWRVLPVPCDTPALTRDGTRTYLVSEPLVVDVECACGRHLSLYSDKRELMCVCARQYRLDGPTVHIWEPVTADVME